MLKFLLKANLFIYVINVPFSTPNSEINQNNRKIVDLATVPNGS